MTPQQAQVYDLLSEARQATVRQIAEAAGIHREAAKSRILRLVSAGLVHVADRVPRTVGVGRCEHAYAPGAAGKWTLDTGHSHDVTLAAVRSLGRCTAKDVVHETAQTMVTVWHALSALQRAGKITWDGRAPNGARGGRGGRLWRIVE